MKNFNFELFNFERSAHSREAITLNNRHQFSRKIALMQRNGLSEKELSYMRQLGLYQESVLDRIPIKEKVKTARAENKLHLRHSELNVLKAADMPFTTAKKLSHLLEQHNFDANPYIRAYRVKNAMRLNLRDCKEMCYKSLFPLLSRHCDYWLSSELPLEVKASVPQLAYEMGLLDGTDRCDRLYRALDELRDMGLLVIIYEFDAEKFQQKPVRIFLLPDFFYSFGHTKENFARIYNQFNNSPKSRAENEAIERRNKAHEERLKRHNVADILANAKNREQYRLLKRVKKALVENFQAYKAEKANKANKAKANVYQRPELPKCPRNAKFGTSAYGEWCRACVNVINTHWKAILGVKQVDKSYWQFLPNSELQLLVKFYKATGDDWAWRPISAILHSRKA